jgi:5'(3')-deoxyribonucleotidase
MNKKIIGVDVDLTVCPSDKGWMIYLMDRAEKEHGITSRESLGRILSKEVLPYDLGQLFPEVDNPLEYWRNLDYTQFIPLDGSIEVLEHMSHTYDIVFISSVKGNHNKLKYYWLEKHFPFMAGYIATKEKYLMNDSIVAMIDDRASVLSKFSPEKRILFHTPYSQDMGSLICKASFRDWLEFPEGLLNLR